MSTWIRITHLPHYISCEAEVTAEFNKFGAIKECIVLPPNPALRTTEAFIQFRQTKHAKLAACDKDSKIIGNNAMNVFVVWCPKETLSTIEIQNLPRHIGNDNLQVEFEAWGEIVDSQISIDATGTAIGRLSYTKVEYAIRAVEEMNGAILDKSDKPLKVKLANPDAKNLKWKRNAFRYIKVDIPKKCHNGNNNNNQRRGGRNKQRQHRQQRQQRQQRQHQHQSQQPQQGSYHGIGNNSMGASSIGNFFHSSNNSRSNPTISTNSGVPIDTNIQQQVQMRLQQLLIAQAQQQAVQAQQQQQQRQRQRQQQQQLQQLQQQQQQQQHRLQPLLMQSQMDLLSIPTSSRLSLTPTFNALSSNGDVSPLRSLTTTPTGASPGLHESKSLPMHNLNNSNSSTNNGTNNGTNKSLNLNFNLSMNLMNTTATLSNPSSLGSNTPSLSSFSQQRNMPERKLGANTIGQISGEISCGSTSCLQSSTMSNAAIYLSPEQSKLLESAKVKTIILPNTTTISSVQSALSKPGLVLSTTSQAAPSEANFAKVQSTPPAPKSGTNQEQLHSHPQWMWSPEQRKLGELLYNRIYPQYSKNAGKIVGVLLHKHRHNLSALKNLITKEGQKQLESTIYHCDQLLNSMGN